MSQYDIYKKDLTTRTTTRNDKLTEIEKLINAAKTLKPGEIGARCEKALSNGTFRPARVGATLCGENNCCGAARVPITNGEGWMTIETC